VVSEGASTLIAALSPSPGQVDLSGFYKERLPTYSGGTAPASHRLPCYALSGTQNGQNNVGITSERRRPLSRRRGKGPMCELSRRIQAPAP